MCINLQGNNPAIRRNLGEHRETEWVYVVKCCSISKGVRCQLIHQHPAPKPPLTVMHSQIKILKVRRRKARVRDPRIRLRLQPHGGQRRGAAVGLDRKLSFLKLRQPRRPKAGAV